MSEREIKLLQGNEACAIGALLAGVNFFAGYPITPSTEIAEYLSREMPKRGGVFIQMEDEIASMGAIIGASLAGARSMTATSGPGFSLKQENLGYASFCEIPCVVVDVMRGGPSTGQPTLGSQADVMQALWGSHGDHAIIALSPSTASESLWLTVDCFNMSDQYRIPAILLLDEVIGHMREKVEIPLAEEVPRVERKRTTVPPEEYLPFEWTDDLIPPWADFGSGYRYHVTGLTHDQRGFPSNRADEAHELLTRLKLKVDRYREEMAKFEELYTDEELDVLVISYGSTARVAKFVAKEARSGGKKVGFLRLITIWPFPYFKIDELVKRSRAVLFCEQNQGQLIGEVERRIGLSKPVKGVFRYDGFLMEPGQIRQALKEVLT